MTPRSATKRPPGELIAEVRELTEVTSIPDDATMIDDVIKWCMSGRSTSHKRAIMKDAAAARAGDKTCLDSTRKRWVQMFADDRDRLIAAAPTLLAELADALEEATADRVAYEKEPSSSAPADDTKSRQEPDSRPGHY